MSYNYMLKPKDRCNFLSTNVSAKVFTIQNESVNMLVVNGTTGNILLNPNLWRK